MKGTILSVHRVIFSFTRKKDTISISKFLTQVFQICMIFFFSILKISKFICKHMKHSPTQNYSWF